MKFVSMAIVLAILAIWLVLAVWQIGAARKEKSWAGIIKILAGSLMAVGAIGFFGTGLLAMSGSNGPPASFEMPVGYAKGVVVAGEGCFVVPHIPAGRVQVYDSNWKFLRGWNVDANAGTFKLFVTDTNHVHVVSARGQRHFEFDLNGRLLAASTYRDSGTNYSSFPNRGEAFWVPTPLYLMVFSSPLFSWMFAALGLSLFAVTEKIAGERRKKRESKR